jgi:hypothetical protein
MRLRLVVLPTIAVTALLATAGGAAASCVQQSVAEQRARAEVIADGVIVAGEKPGEARLRVSRYLKGDGPRELAIAGAGGPGVVSSVDIQPAAGERWRMLGRVSGAGTMVTTACDGSARVESDGRTPAWLAGVLTAVLAVLWPVR